MENFDNIALRAFKKAGLTKYASLPERYAYVQLEDLYFRYKCGDFDKNEAEIRKSKIKKEYNQDIKEYENVQEMFKEFNESRIKNETLLYDLEKSKDKEEIIKIALQIISNCISDNTIIDRYNEKFK